MIKPSRGVVGDMHELAGLLSVAGLEDNIVENYKDDMIQEGMQ